MGVERSASLLGAGLLPSSRAIEVDVVPWILDVMLNSELGRTTRALLKSPLASAWGKTFKLDGILELPEFFFRDHDFDSRLNGLQSIPKIHF